MRLEIKQLLRKWNVFLAAESNILVGGQAVIEGVMMRVPGAYATAVRNPEGKIVADRHDFTSLTEKKPLLKAPVLRGIIGLFEAMKIGFSTLQWSAEIAMPEEAEKGSSKTGDFFATLLAVVLALGLFFILPIWLTSWLFDRDNDPFIFNLLAGVFRVSFFLIYLILISMMKDVRRLFEYHGAEHKTVYTFEAGEHLEIANTYQFPTQHPRCGTSFMLIIAIVAILTFAVIDSILALFVGDIKVWMRLLSHLPLIPLVAGFGYEVLKLTAKHRDNILFRAFAQPGIWLQNITTSQPDDSQVEVAITALKEAFGEDLQKYEGQQFVAEAIG